MLYKLLKLSLILSLSILIYISNSSLTNISLFLLITLTLLNKNNYSLISIIPLFFINQTSFVILLILWIISYLINEKITKPIIKVSSLFLISIIFFSYELLYLNVQLKLILSLLPIISSILLIKLYNDELSLQLNLNVLILSLSILNILYMEIYFFLLLYLIIIIVESLSFNKYYYIITAFFITIFALLKTENLLYIFIQIFAYLGYLFNYLKIKNKGYSDLEYVMEDINTNVSNFCNFLNDFSKITYNDDYEKRISSSIKILIESYCITCKERSTCYSSKKIKTYIFLKELLTKKEQVNTKKNIGEIFDCRYYFAMAESALELQKKYDLISNINLDDIKIIGVCSSVQNYFVSVFEKTSPQVIRLMTFKKKLLELNINFYSFDSKITNEDAFQFKIRSKNTIDLLRIVEAAKNYFKEKDINIDLREGYVCIYPKKKYKVLYDHASLSLNNCQISGDNILIKTRGEVNFICALSDGMGSGYYAYQLSQETLKMVDTITNCNIPFDASLQILNNFFKSREASDSYATLDLVDIDLTKGILNLYKLGSSTTYISRGEKIIPIYNNNLPFGISDLITKEEYSIVDGDLVILVSDGINDYIDESVLIKYIESIKHEAPHKIVYEILQKIYYENKNTIKDDMSCVVIKVKNTH